MLPAADGRLVAGVGRELVPARRLRRARPKRLATSRPDTPRTASTTPRATRAGASGPARCRRPAHPARPRSTGSNRAANPSVAIAGATISNGLDWNLDATRLYYIDSLTQRVDAIDFDVDRGRLGRRRPFARIDPEDGLPDGLCVDAEGGVWIALFGGGAIRRYKPDGTLEAHVALPVTNPTSLAFGGPDRASCS